MPYIQNFTEDSSQLELPKKELKRQKSPYDIVEWDIYKITNPNGRIYIGKTCNFKKRLREYKCIQLKNQNLITRSLVKYGVNQHKFEVIDTFLGDSYFCERKEMFWIRSNMSNFCKFPERKGMNMTNGGGGVLGIKRSAAFCEQARIRATGKPTSALQKLKASELFKGNTYRLGKKQSPEEIAYRMSKIDFKRTPKQIQELVERITKFNKKPVQVTDTKTNTIMGFPSLKDAAEYFKVSRNTVSLIIHGTTKRPNFNIRHLIFEYKKLS